MDASQPARNLSDLQKPLEHFRAKTKRLKVHSAEITVLWVVGIHLVFLPWALGTMRPWAQVISLGFAILAFILSLLPRNYTAEHTGAASFRLFTFPKLLKFPPFWIGLALLGLVTVQGFNPAWNYHNTGKLWWITPRPHIEWLPSGVAVKFEEWGAWRMLAIYTSAWLTMCTVWVAFTRRRTVQLLLVTLAFNGLLLALFGIAQRLFGNGKIFWFVDSPNPQFFSSFIYKNHSGAYLDLTLAVSCGLAAWYYLRGLRRLEKSNPSGVIAFFSTCIAVGILTSYARGATLVMLVFLLATIGAFLVHQIRMPAENRKPIVLIVLVLVFGYFLKTGLEALRSQEAWDRLKAGVTREDLSLEFRDRVTRASWEMLQERWKLGIGAGSYRFVFPLYQHRHPELVSFQGRRIFFEHAHNDILEIPIELGITGVLLLLAGLGWFLFALVRSYFWENALSASVVLGLLLLLGYGWWDFPFQCPAILITWLTLWTIITMWTQFEEMNVKG
ncbi:MAG: O-antigen ligase family protein [Verrucomicrobia bacterium]|nr:O-antigen ligase family protein [Verrucomicrobiota bacterium]